MIVNKKIYSLFILLCTALWGYAQEQVAPVYYNPVVKNKNKLFPSASKATALSLPFFEDFTTYSPTPDAAKWTDRQVYINNTMCVNPISRGVATFDGLGANGLPYNVQNANTLLYADSLTSQPIDLSGRTAADNIYLSFVYQPQGNGFSPETQDSLALYFKKNGGGTPWIRVWAVAGSTVQPFKHVIVPVDDTIFLYNDFQFRFVNKASLNTNDDVWNVDYIRLDANRNAGDTAINDIAYTIEPTGLLNDYVSMPYSQFLKNSSAELATQHQAAIRNNTGFSQTVTYGYVAREKATNTPQFSSPSNSLTLAPGAEQTVSFPVYNITFPQPAGVHEWVGLEQKYYIQSSGSTGNITNDTIVHEQVFHNSLSYDDGTAEKSYYLNLFSTLPGKLAIEHHLNHVDTLKGIAIYFGRQVPLGYQKYFSVFVYSDLGINGGSEQVIYHQDLLSPGYLDVNNFWVYKFDDPVVLPAGTFYIGTTQPALSNSDSLYIGLDVNRVGGNHAYFNVLGYWQSSTVSGALMMRPIFGPIISTHVGDVPVAVKGSTWSLSPDPVSNNVQFHFVADKPAVYEVFDMQGRCVAKGKTASEESVDLSRLTAGIYYARLTINGIACAPQKIIKL